MVDGSITIYISVDKGDNEFLSSLFTEDVATVPLSEEALNISYVMFSTSCKTFGLLWCLTRQNFHKVAVQNTQTFCIMSQPLDKIPDVDIDANGVFKYVLIMVHDDESKQSKPIVRGYSRASWHADIYDETGAQLKQYGSALDTECLGGGRINHNQPEKKILVYGYSQGFGKADHKMTVDLLKKKYPEYDITWSDEGY